MSFFFLQDCVRDSKQRRSDRTSGAAGAHGAFWKNKQITDSSSIENWLRARKKIGMNTNLIVINKNDSLIL